jgi:two-component system sensor kinase FixL
VPAAAEERIRTPTHEHDAALRDAGFGLPRERSRREARGAQVHRPPAVARVEQTGRFKAILAGYVSWWDRHPNSAAHRFVAGNLKPLLEATPVALMVVDEDHRVALVNEPAATLFGYTTEELRGLSFVQLCPRMADEVKRPGAPAGLFVRGAGAAGCGEWQMAVARCKDGSELPVSVQCMHYGPAGAAQWIVTILDPDEQQHAGADDAHSAHLLRVSELGDLAAALAHEINQPLTAVLGNAQAAQRFLQCSPADPSDLREALADIVADSFRATEIVRKLRQLVRGATSETRPLDMGILVRGVTHLMRRNALARGASVTLDIGRHAPMVRGDNIQLQQVMVNLLQNAFDAVEGCGVERRVVTVTTRAAPREGGVSIAVTDHGPGLKADQIGAVFRPFSTSKQQGLGLGLSISSSIVAMHGGRLWAENNEHGGATFHILLPSASEAEGAGSG